MASAQGDPLTDLPPPSRFDPDDLDLPPDDDDSSTPSPPPFVAWNHGNAATLCPKLLIVCFSRPSSTLLHHVPAKKLVASIVLPGVSMADNSIAAPSAEDRTCCLYALDGDSSPLIVAALVQYTVPAASYRDWVRTLFSAVDPEEVVAMELIKPESFRSGLSSDDPMLFLLETDAMRRKGGGDRGHGIPFLPSGSLIDGPAAAVMSYCQMKNVAARLMVSWPEGEVSMLWKGLRKLDGDLLGARKVGFAQASKATVGKRGISSFELFV